MLGDFKYAVRQLRKSPGFAATAVLTLALGIGANTAIFTLVDSIMLRPLPFPQQDRIMRIGYTEHPGDDPLSSLASPFPKGWIRTLGERSTAFSSVSGFGADAESNVGEEGSADRVFGAEVMVNALDTLEVRPELGRFFSAEDARAGSDPVVVLSDGYWRQHFGASPAAIGATLRIDGVSRRILGVMPAGVHFPYADTQFLTPVTFRGGDAIDPWNNFDLRAFGRLRDGVTQAQAQSELRRLQKLMLPLFPWIMPSDWASNTMVVPLLQAEVGSMQQRLMLLFGAVGLILLIACANVANLMLARAAGREKEIAVRSALGASGARLIRQLLAESVVLGAVAGAMGLVAAAASLQALVTLLPADTPRIGDVSLEWPVFVFAAAASVVTGVLFGLIPALRMASPNLREPLHSGSRTVAGKAGQFRVSMVLVVGQIALSVVVITAAGLMLHSLWSLSQVDPGFRSDRVVTAEVSLDTSTCPNPHITPNAPPPGRCAAFFGTLVDRLRGAAGAEDVALTGSLPLVGQFGSFVYDAEGHPREPHQGAFMSTGRVVTPDYFATVGMTLVRGRLLSEQDASGTSRAVVISQSMADRLWPHQNPLGRHLIDVMDEPQPTVWAPAAADTIVGVVNNTHDGSLASGVEDEAYFPLSPGRERPVMYVVMRTRASAQATASEIRRVVADIDPQVPVTRVRSMNEVIAASESAPRSLTILLLAFGGLAVVIGGVGVYSLIAYIVSWRTREIGIRLAVGAQRWQIVAGVVRQSLALAVSGSAIGLTAAALVAQLLRSFLFGVHAVDPITFAAVALLMIGLALAAAWIPARRAASVDPMTTLRME